MLKCFFLGYGFLNFVGIYFVINLRIDMAVMILLFHTKHCVLLSLLLLIKNTVKNTKIIIYCILNEKMFNI